MPEPTAPTIERLEEFSLDGRSAPVSAPSQSQSPSQASTPSQDLVCFETDDPVLSWLKPLFILWLIFASLHVAQLSHLSLSVDNEMVASSSDYLYQISHGRWGAFLVDNFALPMPLVAVPFFPIAVYGFFGAAAYLVAVHTLTGRKPSNLAYLLFPLFIAHPVLQFLEFFYLNTTPQGIALLLAWTGALLYSKIGQSGTRSSLMILGAIICGCLSIAVYQANALILLDCLLIVACTRLLHQQPDTSTEKPLRVFGLIALIMAGSLSLYKLIAEFMMVAFNAEKTGYLDYFFHPELLLRHPLSVIGNTLGELISIYGVGANRYGVPGIAIGVLMAASVIAVVMHVATTKRRAKLFTLSLLASVLLVPFGLSLLNNGASPLRTYGAVPMTFWFFVVFALQLSSRLVQRCGYVLVLAAILTSSYMLSFYAAGAQTARGFDQRTAHAIVQEIEKLIPDFRTTQSNYKLFAFGQIVSNHPYACRTDCTPAIPLFEYEGGNPHRVVGLIKALGLSSVNHPTKAEMQSALPLFEGMPVWPQAGSIRVVDKTILLKLGEPSPATDDIMRAVGAKL